MPRPWGWREQLDGQSVHNAPIKAPSGQPDASTSTPAIEANYSSSLATSKPFDKPFNMCTLVAVFLVAVLSVAAAAPSAILAPGAALAGPLLGPAALSGPIVGPAALAGPATGPARLSGAVDGGAIVTGAVAGPSLVSGSVAGAAAPWPAVAAPWGAPWGE